MTDWGHADFWVALAPAVFSKKRMAVAPREVDQLLDLLAVPAGVAILDLGCGVGRHAVALAQRGYRVAGLDFAAELLARGRAEATRLGLAIEWIAADMRELERPESFDAVLNLNSSFGLLQDDADILEVARRVRRSLRGGGAFLLEMVGREILSRAWRDRWWTEFDDAFVVEERSVRPGWKYVDSRWILVERGVRRELSATQRLFSAAELRRLLTAAGFASVELFGNLRGAPYDDDARRLVALARVGP